MEQLSHYAAIVSAIALLLTAWVANRGLNAWRGELVGRRQADMAEEVLASFYEAQKVLIWIRSPAAFSSESEGREKESTEDAKLSGLLDMCYVPLHRLSQKSEFFSNVFSKRFRFMAQFGRNSELPFLELNEVVSKIEISSMMLSELYKKQNAGTAKDQININNHHAVLFSVGDQDTLSQRINQIVAEVEKVCRPAIEAQAANRRKRSIIWWFIVDKLWLAKP